MHVKACFCFCPVQMNLWARLCQMELWKPFLGLLMYLHRCLYVTMTSVTRPDRKARGDDDCWQLNRCWQRYYFSYQLSTNYCLDMYFPTGNGYDLGQWWCYLAASALRSGGAVSSIIQQLSTFVYFRCKIKSTQYDAEHHHHMSGSAAIQPIGPQPPTKNTCHIVHLFITRSDSAALPDKNPFSPPKLEFFSNIGQLTIFSCNASVGWRQTWQTFCLLN